VCVCAAQADIPCSYVLLSGLSYIMREVSKVRAEQQQAERTSMAGPQPAQACVGHEADSQAHAACGVEYASFTLT